MKGIVIGINHKKGFIAVHIYDNEYTVFEILGGYDVKMNDIISGNLESLGGEIFFNQTQSEKMDVFVQDIHCTKNRVLQLMRS